MIAPKSRHGRRTVPIAAPLRDHLDQHRLTTGSDEWLFTSARWVQSSNDRARKTWTAAGLPVLTLHEARHTGASLMIAASVNLKAVSTFMGHANIGVTLDLYGHLLPGSETAAVALFDTYLAREVGGSTFPQALPHPVDLAV
jgi:integrase